MPKSDKDKNVLRIWRTLKYYKNLEGRRKNIIKIWRADSKIFQQCGEEGETNNANQSGGKGGRHDVQDGIIEDGIIEETATFYQMVSFNIA